MKNINYKKIIYSILKVFFILIILSVFLKIGYEIVNNFYENENKGQQNEVNEVNVLNNSKDVIKNDKEEKWYVDLYWKFASVIFIIYAIYNYRKKWYREYFNKKTD